MTEQPKNPDFVNGHEVGVWVKNIYGRVLQVGKKLANKMIRFNQAIAVDPPAQNPNKKEK